MTLSYVASTVVTVFGLVLPLVCFVSNIVSITQPTNALELRLTPAKVKLLLTALKRRTVQSNLVWVQMRAITVEKLCHRILMRH